MKNWVVNSKKSFLLLSMLFTQASLFAENQGDATKLKSQITPYLNVAVYILYGVLAILVIWGAISLKAASTAQDSEGFKKKLINFFVGIVVTFIAIGIFRYIITQISSANNTFN